MLVIQIILVPFLVFAITRVILRFREGQLSIIEFLFWTFLFVAATVGIIFPDSTTKIAKLVGIGRGADLVVYASIVALFYLVFRIYIAIENVRSEITELTRGLALENIARKSKRKRVKRKK